mgnify:FL=1
MKKIFLLLVIIFISCSNQKAKVIGVKDGDTIVVLLKNNETQTLRLAEIDCPEKSQSFGVKAKQFTSSQVYGKYITFSTITKDKYGRSIAKVYYDNKYLSEEIIKAGFAWFYKRYSNNKRLELLEHEAKRNKLGIWSDKTTIEPYKFRLIFNK